MSNLQNCESSSQHQQQRVNGLSEWHVGVFCGNMSQIMSGESGLYNCTVWLYILVQYSFDRTQNRTGSLFSTLFPPAPPLRAPCFTVSVARWQRHKSLWGSQPTSQHDLFYWNPSTATFATLTTGCAAPACRLTSNLEQLARRRCGEAQEGGATGQSLHHSVLTVYF